jgi:glycosyltransferase involved in cell wall biosynthesis
VSGPPAVAVIIAARDPGPFLVEALASVAAQTVLPAVTVVVDDGSTDGNVDRALADFPEVVLIRQPPLGRSQARNRGVEEADAEALLFLDADDRLRPRTIEVLAQALSDDDTLELVHGRTFEFADETLPPGPGVRPPSGIVTARFGGATLLTRDLWTRVGPLDTSLPRGEWIEWMHRAYAAGAVAVQVDDVVLERRLHGGNRTAGGNAGKDHYLNVARAALARKRSPTSPAP